MTKEERNLQVVLIQQQDRRAGPFYPGIKGSGSRRRSLRRRTDDGGILLGGATNIVHHVLDLKFALQAVHQLGVELGQAAKLGARTATFHVRVAARRTGHGAAAIDAARRAVATGADAVGGDGRLPRGPPTVMRH